MPEVLLTRRYRFSSSHRLHSPALGEGENRELYGKCNNPFGHGHDYTLEVTVRGRVDPGRGRLLPVAQLDALARRAVIEPLDRRNLNTDVEEFATLVPTTENLAVLILGWLSAAWKAAFAGHDARLEKVRIWETRRNIFELSVGVEQESAETRTRSEESYTRS